MPDGEDTERRLHIRGTLNVGTGKIYPGDKSHDSEPDIPLPSAPPNELLFGNRIANSIIQNGVNYIYQGMRNGQAVYVRDNSTPSNQPEKQGNTLGPNSTVKQPEVNKPPLPPGAILDRDFTGRNKYVGGKIYRLAQPSRQVDGKWVYVPYEENK